MIPRYSTPTMTALFADENRLKRWLDVEIASAAAWEAYGVVPAGASARLAEQAKQVDFARLVVRAREIEETTQHDVIAFLAACEEVLGDDARHLHFGMTSSDVVDSAFALVLNDATVVILSATDDLLGSLAVRARAFQRTPCLGRTHGQAAEPTTFGLKLLSMYAEFSRSRTRLEAAQHEIQTGKLSGAVGNYGHIPPEIEATTLQRLGLRVEPVATQVIPRDRHASLFCALAILGGAIERLAVEIRHLQRHEVKEVFEPFGKGQRGSSAMPHKKNPILSENLTGLARLLRSYAQAALENVALWHERDISHSSVERVIAADACTIAHFALVRCKRLVDGMVVDAARMKTNLDSAGAIVASGGLLLALVKKGVMRQEAYGWVQRCALGAGGGFAAALKADADVQQHLTPAEIDELLSLDRQLQYVDGMFDRVLPPS